VFFQKAGLVYVPGKERKDETITKHISYRSQGNKKEKNSIIESLDKYDHNNKSNT